MDSLKYSLVFLLKNRQKKEKVEDFKQTYSRNNIIMEKKKKEGRKTGEKKENQEVCWRFKETFQKEKNRKNRE